MASQMRDAFDRLFDRFARGWPGLAGADGWRWGLDVREDGDAVVVRAEASGFEAGDFDLQVDDARLVLRAARKAEIKGKEDRPQEYREQECYQSVALPSEIDTDRIEAVYRNGVLTVTLPRTANGRAKRIHVKDG
jgi:HSP20 family protein